MNRAPLSARQVAALGALATGISWAVAVAVRGRVHADEVFQALEPASRLALGHGEVTWEWKEGLRNWATPGAIALWLRVGTALGMQSVPVLLGWVELACAAAYGLGVASAVRLLDQRDGPDAARIGGLVLATWGGLAVYAARPLGDALALAPLMAAWRWQQAAVDGAGAQRQKAGLRAGVLLGLAVIVRYGSLVFVASSALDLIRQRRLRPLVGLVLGLALMLGALGALDAATWGSAFHSLAAYWRFNGLHGRVGEVFGTRPFWWYGGMLAAMLPWLLVPAFARGLGRLDGPVLAFALYLLAVEVHPHKDARFLLPLVPLWIVIAAGPLARQMEALPERARTGLIGLQACLAVASGTVLLPFGLRREELDGMIACGQSARAGVHIVNRDGWPQAGAFHLGRDAPVEMMSNGNASRALVDPAFDCAIIQDEGVPERVLLDARYQPFWSEGRYRAWRR